MIASMWRNLTAEEKQVYHDKYMEKLETYKEELQSFTENLTSEQQEELKEEQKKRRLKRKKMRQKKLFRTFGKPRKPVSPFAHYLREKLPGVRDMQKEMKIIAETWKGMSQEELEIYEKKSHDDYLRYEAEMEQWEQEMLADGRVKLVQAARKADKYEAKLEKLSKKSQKVVVVE